MTTHTMGLIGLAVMGQNLALNIADHGFSLAVFNRSQSVSDDFVKQFPHDNIQAFNTLQNLVASLQCPRKILLMIKAGEPVDQLIEQLLPLLAAGDTIIDGGNSNFVDSERRFQHLQAQKIAYVAMGISGGEEGARHGPAIMPGGDAAAWPQLAPIFQAIAADVDGEPCCRWLGGGGAGHFVKMVHNGIEYGDMQLIAEVYQLLRVASDFTSAELADIFSDFNQGVLDSYLIEITADILRHQTDGKPTIDSILDTAGQKGTGNWTAKNALDLGTPLSLIAESVYARALSSRKNERINTAALFKRSPCDKLTVADARALLKTLESALYGAKILSYCQGFMLLRDADTHYGWDINFADVAQIWRGGCIIRSQFLGDITAAFSRKANLENLLQDDFFQQALLQAEPHLRAVLKVAMDYKVATPCLSAALAFFDGLLTVDSPANLIQAQRDYFGAHTYEKVGHARGEFFHTLWQVNAPAEQKL